MTTKERPILFSGAMVRAILDGRKTQTRRVVKPGKDRFTGCALAANELAGEVNVGGYTNSPYKPGERLWVRETFSRLEAFDFFNPDVPEDVPGFWYWADGEPTWGDWTRPKPSIHMPREACRIQLEITDVRVEKLGDCSEADAAAEGVEPVETEREERDLSICRWCGGTRLYTAFSGQGGALPDTDCLHCDTHLKRYEQLWDHINGAGAWDANPWVWVVEFRRTA